MAECEKTQIVVPGAPRDLAPNEWRGVVRVTPQKPKPPSNECVICNAPLDPKSRRYAAPPKLEVTREEMLVLRSAADSYGGGALVALVRKLSPYLVEGGK